MEVFNHTLYSHILGSAGIGVSSILSKTNDVLVVDPSDKHYYQPGWTMVGAGLYDVKDTEKPMSDVIPPNTDYLKVFNFFFYFSYLRTQFLSLILIQIL